MPKPRAVIENPDKVKIVGLIVLLGFICAILFHYREAAYLGLRYPHNTFLFKPWDVGGDFINIYTRFVQGTVFSYGTYPPFAYVPLYLLRPFPGAMAYHVFLITFVIGALFWIYSQLATLTPLDRVTATITTTLFTYPFLYALDRGNLENWLFLFLMFSLWLFTKQRYRASAILLGMAIAMKVYPGAFVALFLSRRKFKEAGIAIAVAIVVTALGLIPYDGPLHEFMAALGKNFAGYKAQYILGDDGLRFSSNYFAVIKYFLIVWLPNRVSTQSLLVPYFFACLAGYLFIAVYVIFIEKQLWKQVLLLTLSVILFPQVSYDYKQVHLFLPLGLFFAATEKGKRNLHYAVLFGLLLIPKAYVWPLEFDEVRSHYDINLGILINPLIMTLMAFLVLEEGFSVAAIKEAFYEVRNFFVRNKPATTSKRPTKRARPQAGT